MDDEYESESIDKTSKINAAGLINLILADLWKNCYRHSANGSYSKWNAELNNIWTELSGDVDEKVDAGKETEEKFNDIDMELAEVGSLHKPTVTGFQETTSEQKLSGAKQYRILLRKAVFLKRLQNKQGKGTAYRDESDFYMD